ncbi:hypothetical protein [Streptomyces capitiformicae]|uniref:Uncharacterized protein n=1 Tax=Streptomyces capitiformicae TaxID=2014920 RepID=A0A919GCX8_9ACTN|nr:hypothetical protein [Streptomyces capitiformicae]GHH82174.1 hypothetical protein GCM10017771_05660 [Streptomyces capitiformicae]
MQWAVRSVVLLVLRLLVPAGGRRRRPPGRAREKSPPGTNGRNVNDNSDPPTPSLTLRSPYSTDHAPFDGNATALTRPYLYALDIWLPEATAALPVGVGVGVR